MCLCSVDTTVTPKGRVVPESLRQLSFVKRCTASSRKPQKVRVSGYEADTPAASPSAVAGLFFPVVSARNDNQNRTTKAPISLIVPCYNEEALSLERTLRSLREQILPEELRLEVVVVMDGWDRISNSMNNFLQELFLINVDETFRKAPKTINSIVAELEVDRIQPGDLGLSLVIKRNNHGKVDSQRWWLGSHSPAVRCQYSFQTDCGIRFDPHCIGLMYKRLEMDPNVVGASCHQRTMSVEQQGQQSKDINGLLRLMQMADMEDSIAPTRVFNNIIGYAGVVPGSGGLYRFSSLGSLEEGPIKGYFDICTKSFERDEGIMLGNIRLAEDRVLPSMAMYQTHDECQKRGLIRPRLCYLIDALSYVEAEDSVEALVKQRRRWGNGAFFRAVFIWRNYHKILNSAHSLLFKITATGFITIDTAQKLIYAPVMAPFLASVVYAITKLLAVASGLLNVDGDPQDMLTIINSTESSLVLAGLVPACMYMAVYAYFVIQHTPRAIGEPVYTEGIVTGTAWSLDKKSAYHSGLWSLHNRLHICLHFLILVTLYWYGFLGIALWKMFRSYVQFSVMEVACWLAVYGKLRPEKLMVTLVAGVLQFAGANLARSAWYQSYCVVRFTDCSWGNRAGSHESGGQQAKHSQYVGRMICAALLVVNVFCFWLILHRIHSGVDVFLLAKQRFDVLFVVHAIDPYVAFPTGKLGAYLVRLFFVWALAVYIEATLETGQKGTGRATSGPIFFENSDPSFIEWKCSVTADLMKWFSGDGEQQAKKAKVE